MFDTHAQKVRDAGERMLARSRSLRAQLSVEWHRDLDEYDQLMKNALSKLDVVSSGPTHWSTEGAEQYATSVLEVSALIGQATALMEGAARRAREANA